LPHWSNMLFNALIGFGLPPPRPSIIYVGMISFVSVCLSVCLSVCQTITFENLDIGSSYLNIWYLSREYRSSSYMKVIGSRLMSLEQKGRKFPFPPCKTSIGNNSGSIKHRAMTFAHSMEFLVTADRMV